MTLDRLEIEVMRELPRAEVWRGVTSDGGPAVVVRQTVEFCFVGLDAEHNDEESLRRLIEARLVMATK